MVKITVLGLGCMKCEKTLEAVKKAAAENGVEAEIEKVSELNKIMEYDVMLTPAVAVDGKVVISGKVPSEEEIKKILGI